MRISKEKGKITNLDAYKDKFSEKGKRILESALEESRRRNQNFVAPEHILYALMIEDFDLFDSKMKSLSIDSGTVRAALEKRLANGYHFSGMGFRIAPQTTEIFKFSMDKARAEGRRVIDSTDLLSVFTNKCKYLFDDILENPERRIHPLYERGINPSILSNKTELSEEERKILTQLQTDIGMEYLTQLQETQSNFFSKLALEEVVKNNELLSVLFFVGNANSGGSGGGIINNEIKFSNHSSLSFSYKLDDGSNFSLEEILLSLKTDVENCLNLNQLKITKARTFYSSFILEYETENLTGKINISGEITRNYFQLSVTQDETYLKKK